MKTGNGSAAWVLMLLFISSVALAEPEVNSKYKYYLIFPESKYDLESEMEDNSPIIKNENKFNGNTHWKVSWNYRFESKNGICWVTEVSTTLDVVYTMPKIPASHEVDSETREIFENYYAALLKHEKGHMKSGLSAAREIEKTLKNLRKFKSCSKLKARVKSSVDKIIEKYNRLDEKYDRDTYHGESEGVDIENFL